MSSIGLTLDTASFARSLQLLADRDVKIAATWALNDTADEALTAVQDRMKVVFDRPTQFTLNAFYVRKARVSALEASVEERPTRARRDYLKTEEQGGARFRTGFEVLASTKLAYDGFIQSIIPGDEAKLDANGNWSAGERNKVMSDLKIQRDSAANATARSTARRRRKGGATYFVPKTGLYPGIYRKSSDGRIGIVAVISPKAPVYQQRLGFFEEAQKVFAARFAPNFSRTLGQMIAKRFG
ncbi:hypothetical protein [Paenirhodobacter enshiensis]|uniref:hypothetical protein n=1 Tax=Paenirhodobacter enshiensis TaxID=1105367 RepID=UPI003FA284CD